MNILKIFFSILASFLITINLYAAGSDSNSTSKIKSDYDKAIKLIKSAKKYEIDNKIKKAEKNYKKANKILIAYNKKKPGNADILNYLGFTTRKLGDFKNGEKYYLQGLAIEPKHVGINEYLGELYVVTGRHNLAIERLEVLSDCNCEEYQELKDIIAGKKVSKY
tara:strand:+ start:3367 stop:3861 length:495 start_codon:yes stop_codon:yes gene_type:complete